jgi:hypothetical protein
MRHASRLGPHSWLLIPAVVLALAGLTTGCGSSSSTPNYCAAASQLKTSVHNLGNVDVAKNGLSSLNTALSSVASNAKTLASEAKSTFAPQTTALRNSLSALDTAIKSAKGQSPLAAVQAVVSSLTQVRNSATNLAKAVSGKCH